MRTIIRFITMFALTAAITGCHSSKPKKSPDDLQVAFNHESKAAAKYARFAQEARKERYDTIALLFEAVSKSEHIHALNHKKVLEKFTSNSGDAEIGNYEVKTTAENLQDAIKNETYELQTMYPKFIREAENEKIPEVAKTFTLAWESEKRHLPIYRKALGSVTNGTQTGLPVVWYICPTCGNIYSPTDSRPFCEFCLTKQENFIGYVKEQE